MKKSIYNSVSAFLLFCVFVLTMVACNPENGEKANRFALSQEAVVITEGETVVINVSGGTDFTISTDNDYARCEKNSNATISVTGIKVGKCILSVKKGDDSLTCAITIEKSAAQKDFEIYSTSRVENWQPETVNTETTAGLQVTCERGVDASGWELDDNTTTYGFFFTETGSFLRLSAEGNFGARGKLSNGVVAIQEQGAQVQYYLCESVEVVKVHNGKSWIVATMASHPDVRIVTEAF